MPTVAEMIAALQSLDPALTITDTHVSLRAVHLDGRCQHVTIDADGSVRAQEAPANPRLIPHGRYCYEAVSMDTTPDGLPALTHRPCPFWTPLEGMNARCGFLDREDWSCLGDQVKVCGVNELGDDEDEDVADRMWREHLGIPADPTPSG